MRRVLMISALAGALAAPAAAAAAPVRVSAGPLHALAADGATAHAVVDNAADKDRPLALVRSSGRSAGVRTPFGEPNAEFPDIAVGDDGVVVQWGRMASGGELWFAAPIAALDQIQILGQGTGPGRLALDGDRRVLAAPDQAGNAMVVTGAAGGALSRRPLTDTGPHERHLPLDVVVADGAPLVLDLGQTPALSQLRVLGARAPREPVVRVRRLQTIQGTVAVSGRSIRVAYLLGGRAYLATARTDPDAAWRVRRLPGPGGGAGSAAVTPGGQVLFTQKGAGRHDVYLWDGRLRRLTRTATDEESPHLAAGGTGPLFAGWTRRDRRARRTDSMLLRVR